jgi:hypothetical protein
VEEGAKAFRATYDQSGMGSETQFLEQPWERRTLRAQALAANDCYEAPDRNNYDSLGTNNTDHIIGCTTISFELRLHLILITSALSTHYLLLSCLQNNSD